MSFVVIVEPDEVIQANLRDFLETIDQKKMFEYMLVRTPDRAVELLEQRCVDVLVSEVEMPLISGKELFSLAEMISPDTVRIALTNALEIEETVAFMNECKAYKIIITPCKVARDILAPIESALEYKRLMDQLKQENELVNDTINEAESDYQKLEQLTMKHKEEYQSMLSMITELAHKNIGRMTMDTVCQQKMKNWYTWVLNAFYQNMIAANGNYMLCQNTLMNEFHYTEREWKFAMYKKEDFEIEPAKMNTITFIIMLMAYACKQLLAHYDIRVLLECVEKYYIVHFECNYASSMDNQGNLIFEEDNMAYIQELKKVTEKFVESFSYRVVPLEKEESYMVNIAVER